MDDIETVKIAYIDDKINTKLRNLLRKLRDKYSDTEYKYLVKQSNDTDQIIDYVEKFRPDVLLLDMNFKIISSGGDQYGLNLYHFIKRYYPQVNVIIVSDQVPDSNFVTAINKTDFNEERLDSIIAEIKEVKKLISTLSNYSSDNRFEIEEIETLTMEYDKIKNNIHNLTSNEETICKLLNLLSEELDNEVDAPEIETVTETELARLKLKIR